MTSLNRKEKPNIINVLSKEIDQNNELLQNFESISSYLAENANNLLLFLDVFQSKRDKSPGLISVKMCTELKQELVNIVQQYRGFYEKIINLNVSDNKEFSDCEAELIKMTQALRTLSRKITAIHDFVHELNEDLNMNNDESICFNDSSSNLNSSE